jgi:DNA invertase Pin-like site-specific DNA recombinase
MEGVLAAFAQFDNDCRSDRTRAGMKAALELGRWTFLAPIGYLNARRAMRKSLMADPDRAPHGRRAFEEYATGRFTKQQVLVQTRAWGLTNRRNRPLTSQAIGPRRKVALAVAKRNTQCSKSSVAPFSNGRSVIYSTARVARQPREYIAAMCQANERAER